MRTETKRRKPFTPFKWGLLSLFCLLGFFPSDALFAETSVNKFVKKIEFRGVVNLSERDLRANLHTRVGQPYDPLKIRQDIKTFGKWTRKCDVYREEEGDGVKVTYVLEEAPILREISIVGNRKASTPRILASLETEPGKVFSVNAENAAVGKVLREYEKLGHSETKVETDLMENDDGTVSLQVRIDEGEKLKIKKLNIQGNQSISTMKLKLLLQSNGSWLFGKRYFQSETFQNDLMNLAAYYRRLGYLEVDVRAGRFEYDAEKGRISPAIVIDEGSRYQFDRLDVRGATLFSREELVDPFHDLLGVTFDGKQFKDALTKASRLYQNEGYMATKVMAQLDLDRDKKKVSAILNVEERPRVYIRSLLKTEEGPKAPKPRTGSIFDSLNMTFSAPVRNEVFFREVNRAWPELAGKGGEELVPYRKDREEELVNRLRRLGVFESVSVWSEPYEGETVHDLIIDAKETPTGRVRVGAGVGDARGAFGFVTYTERNLFGEANVLSARLIVGTRAVNFDVSYLDRYWRDSETSLGTRIYNNYYRRRGYYERRVGSELEFGKELHEELRRYLGLRLGRTRLEDNRDKDDDLDDYWILTGKVRYVKDTRDSVANPTKGSVKGAGLEAGYAGGPLVKLSGYYTAKRRVTPKLDYALNAKLGLMPFDADKVGLGERFFLGGSDDMRGFDYRGAGPNIDNGHIHTGGATKVLVQNELHFPIFEQNLTGLVFADAGVIGEGPLDLSDPRFSVGTGVRFTSKYFSGGVDFAVPLLKKDSDKTRWVHFKMGSSF